MIPSADGGGSLSASSTYKKTGGYGLYSGYSAGVDIARFPVAGTPADPSASFWIYAYEQYALSQKMRFYWTLGTGELIELRWNNGTHTFDAYVNTALVASGSVSVASNNWFHVQFYAVIADAGSIGVKINGHQSISYSGDTQPGVATGATYFSWYTYQGRHAIDDLVIGSGGYLGDLRCVDIRPTADTAQDDWTPSTGDNFETINETPPSDADYNETNTNAQADELALGDFDGVIYTPVAVTAWARAEMLAATGDSLKVGIVSNAVEVTTTSALSTSWEYYFHTEDENPDGPVAWDDAAIDALLFRYESVIP
jgi:hypothetical protein